MNKELVFMLVGLVLGGIIIGYGLAGGDGIATYVTDRDTTTYVDTIPYYQPVAKDSAVVRYVTRVLPVKGRDNITTNKTDTFLAENSRTAVLRLHPAEHVQAQLCSHLHENYAHNPSDIIRDSAAVAIPITQKRYEGDDYRAYVSGYEPSLDSIFVFPKTTVIRERSRKPPNKWHIGITGGYGYGFKSKEAEPYIGIGITYSIISF